MDLFSQHDYINCAKRLTYALYNEFSDWEAVYGVIERHIDDKEFTDKMFHLLKFVYTYIKIEPDAEELLRDKAKRAIQCLHRIDRQSVHVETIDHIICAILLVDKDLDLIDEASENYLFSRLQFPF